MPNFGDVRKTLAKEASWVEPEEPEETEDESTFLMSPLIPLPDVAVQEGTASFWIANQLSLVCNDIFGVAWLRCVHQGFMHNWTWHERLLCGFKLAGVDL